MEAYQNITCGVKQVDRENVVSILFPLNIGTSTLKQPVKLIQPRIKLQKSLPQDMLMTSVGIFVFLFWYLFFECVAYNLERLQVSHLWWLTTTKKGIYQNQSKPLSKKLLNKKTITKGSKTRLKKRVLRQSQGRGGMSMAASHEG